MVSISFVIFYPFLIAIALGQSKVPAPNFDFVEVPYSENTTFKKSLGQIKPSLKTIVDPRLRPGTSPTPVANPQNCKNASIVFVVDISGSLRYHKQNLKDFSTIFFDTFSMLQQQNAGQSDGQLELAVAVFSSNAGLLCDFNCNLQQARQDLSAAIDGIGGSTNTAAGLKLALDTLAAVTNTHKSVVLISDGGPDSASAAYVQADALRASGTVVHSIFLNTYGDPNHPYLQTAMGIMDKIAFDNTTSHLATDFGDTTLAAEKLKLVFKRICDDADDGEDDDDDEGSDCGCNAMVAVAVVPMSQKRITINFDLQQSGIKVDLKKGGGSKPKGGGSKPKGGGSKPAGGKPQPSPTPPPAS